MENYKAERYHYWEMTDDKNCVILFTNNEGNDNKMLHDMNISNNKIPPLGEKPEKSRNCYERKDEGTD
jgi:hypothetical protein